MECLHLVAGSFILVVLVHSRRHNYPREYVPRSEYLPRTLKAIPGLAALVLLVGGILYDSSRFSALGYCSLRRIAEGQL